MQGKGQVRTLFLTGTKIEFVLWTILHLNFIEIEGVQSEIYQQTTASPPSTSHASLIS